MLVHQRLIVTLKFKEVNKKKKTITTKGTHYTVLHCCGITTTITIYNYYLLMSGYTVAKENSVPFCLVSGFTSLIKDMSSLNVQSILTTQKRVGKRKKKITSKDSGRSSNISHKKM